MQNKTTTKTSKGNKTSTSTASKKVVETECASCEKVTKCSFKLESRKVSDPSQHSKYKFCTNKCQQDYKKQKLKADYVTETLESVYESEEHLTSDTYQIVPSSAPWSSFYKQLLCIFHSKVFKGFASRLAFLTCGMKNQRGIQKQPKSDCPVEIGFDEFFTAAGNLCAVLKKGSEKTLAGNEPAIETFAFIRHLLLRSQDMSQANRSQNHMSRCPSELQFFDQYYPEAKDLSVDKQVLYFLVYMFAQMLLVNRTDPKLRDEDLHAEPISFDLEKEIEDIKLLIAEGQPLVSEAEIPEVPDYQPHWDQILQGFFKQLATSRIIDLPAVLSPWALPRGCTPGYVPYFHAITASASRLGKLSEQHLKLQTNEKLLEIPLIGGTSSLKIRFRRIRTCLIQHFKVTYPFKFAVVTTELQKQTATKELKAQKVLSVLFLEDEEDVSAYLNLGPTQTLRIVRILQTLTTDRQRVLSSHEMQSLSHTPPNLLTAVEYLYFLEKPPTTDATAFLSELYAIRTIDLHKWAASSQQWLPVQATQEFLLDLLEVPETTLRIKRLEIKGKYDQSQPTKAFYQVTNQVMVELLEQPVQAGVPQIAETTRTAQRLAAVLKEHKQILKSDGFANSLALAPCKLYFDYDMQEILEALIGTQELEKLQQDVVEKKGPPTVLMIQFEKGMQLPMLGYYFLRAFSAGENLFTLGLPKKHILGISSFENIKAEAAAEIFLNTGDHLEFRKRDDSELKVNFFSSAQGALNDTPVTFFEPEWITQIIYELQEKPKTAAP